MKTVFVIKMGHSDSDSDNGSRSRGSRRRGSSSNRREESSSRREKSSKSTQEEKKQIPFQKAYPIDLPPILVKDLLKANGIKGDCKDYQLKIFLDKKK